MKRATLSALLLGLVAPIPAPAAPAGGMRVAKVFGDHMVVQRGVPLPVWGWADPGEKVVVSLGGKAAAGTADKEGKWTVKLPAIKQPGGPYELIVAGRAAVTFKDVIVGDVWLCGGQSNMEWRVNACNAPDEMQNARFPLIRCFRVEKKSASSPLKDTNGTWQVCSPAAVGEFTAVGYFFARHIHQETKIPIGLIDASWSATAIEPWIALDSLKTVPELAGLHAEAAKQMAAWAGPDQHPFAWSVLYNGLIAPVAPCAIKGALWYQGEGNGGEEDSYYHKMRALIGGWRQAFGVGDFPFYFVQLAAFQPPSDDPAGLDGWGWGRCRMAQLKSLQIPNTGMAVAIDIGDAAEIHPRNKQDVGRRLALWALAKDYGKKNVVFSGPLYKQMAVEKDRIRIAFESVGGGLMVGRKDGLAPTVEAKGGKLQRFAIAGADRKWVWANADIDGKTVVVWSEKVPNPVAVRYACSMNPQGANLYNKEGLPASPFRTDDW